MSSQRIFAQGHLAAALLAGAALLGLVNYLGFRHYTRWDFTRGGVHSLAPKTIDILGALDRPLRIISFLPEEGLSSPDTVREIRALLESLRQKNPQRITLETLDPLRDPLKARALLTEFGIDPLRDPVDVVVVQSGPRRKQVRLEEMVELDQNSEPGMPAPVKSLKAEDVLMAAIVGVTRDRQPQVLFAQGHGERDPRSSGEIGLSRLVEALGREDIQVSTWESLGSTAVPEGTSVVVAAAPASIWLEPERKALEAYLERGGRVLLLFEPSFQRGTGGPVKTGLEPLLERWGITVVPDVAIDPSRALPFFGAETFYADSEPGHPITAALGGQPVLFVLASSLRLNPAASPDLRLQSLVAASAQAWGETDLAGLQKGVAQDASDTPGPFPLVAAAEHTSTGSSGKSPGGRLVVGSDVDLAANLAFDQLANRPFVLNIFSWLLEEDRSLGIPPKDRTLSRLFLTQQQLISVFLVTVVLLPLVTVAAGLLVWMKRRRT